jgi:hypothetical protein
MIQAGVLQPRNMSKRQRKNAMIDQVKLPGYLRRTIMMMDTDAKVQFNKLAYGMVQGKIFFDTEALIVLRDQIDRERYATPKREVEENVS